MAKRLTHKIIWILFLLIMVGCGRNASELNNSISQITPAYIPFPEPPEPMPNGSAMLTYTMIVPPTFDAVLPFADGLARVRMGDIRFMWDNGVEPPVIRDGIIDTKGNEVVSLVYEWVSDFRNGVAWARMPNGDTFIIDVTGRELFMFPEFWRVDLTRSFSEGFLVFHKQKDNYTPRLYGVIDKTGTVVVPPVYQRILDFNDGLAPVSVGERDSSLWGFINTQGYETIPPQFESVNNFSNGVAPVRRGSWPDIQAGMIDNYGNVVVPFIYGNIMPVQGGLARTYEGGVSESCVGFINTIGDVVVPFIYTDAQCFSEGLAAVETEGLWGFIDGTGCEIVYPQFNFVRPFQNGLAAVAVYNGLNDRYERQYLWGFVNTAGEIVVEPMYEWVGCFSEELAVVNKGAEIFVDAAGEPHSLGGTYKIIDRWGRVMLTLEEFDGVGSAVSEGTLAVNIGRHLDRAYGHWYLPVGGKWGFIRLDK